MRTCVQPPIDTFKKPDIVVGLCNPNTGEGRGLTRWPGLLVEFLSNERPILKRELRAIPESVIWSPSVICSSAPTHTRTHTYNTSAYRKRWAQTIPNEQITLLPLSANVFSIFKKINSFLLFLVLILCRYSLINEYVKKKRSVGKAMSSATV